MVETELAWDNVLVSNLDDLTDFSRRFSLSGRVAIDTETTGLLWARGDRPFLSTFCADYDRVFATYDPIIMARVMQIVQSGQMIFHHAKFDLHMIRTWIGEAPESYFDLNLADTMHAFRIQYPLDSGALKVASKRYLDGKIDVTGPQAKVAEWRKAHSIRERVNGKWVTTEPGFDKVSADIMLPYAAQDVWMTLYCHDRLAEERSKLPRRQAELYEREVRIVKLLLHSEQHGWPLDYDVLMSSLERSCEEFDAALAALEKMAPGLNISSPLQIRHYIYDVLGEPVKHRVKKTNNPSTDETTLLDLDHKEEGLVLLNVRRWKKARDKYSELALYLDENSRVHSDFKPERAKTGRFGSATPALQNVANPHGYVTEPEEYHFCKCHKNDPSAYSHIRDVFRPPPGFEWLFVDYSQIEMRIFAHYCQDRYLVDAILKGLDLHALTAMRMYGIVDIAAVAKAQRAFGKIMNFTIVYGGGRNKIATALREGSAQNDPLTVDEAQRALLMLFPQASASSLADPYELLAAVLLRVYKEQFPDIATFTDEVQKTIRYRHSQEGQGYVKNVFGRVTPVPLDKAYRGVNYIIQGTAADLLKDAMLNSWQACEGFAKVHHLKPWTDIAEIGNIHDELIFQVREGYAVELAKHLHPVLTHWPMLSLPIDVDFAHVAQGSSWARKKELKLVA